MTPIGTNWKAIWAAVWKPVWQGAGSPPATPASADYILRIRRRRR